MKAVHIIVLFSCSSAQSSLNHSADPNFVSLFLYKLHPFLVSIFSTNSSTVFNKLGCRISQILRVRSSDLGDLNKRYSRIDQHIACTAF